MFEGDPADMCAGQFPLVSMGGQVEGLACADPGARTPIGASGNYILEIIPKKMQISMGFGFMTNPFCQILSQRPCN